MGEADPDELKSDHIVFVDNEKDIEKFDEAEFFDTPAELLTRAYNRPKHETLSESLLMNTNIKASEMWKIESQRKRAYQELEARMKRGQELEEQVEEIRLKKQLSKNGNVIKKMKDDKPVYKWRNVRQK